MRKILPLKGPNSMRALNAYNALLLGLWMLPNNLASTDRLKFLEEMKALPPERLETWLREAISFVKLDAEEIGAMISFATDNNGIPYGSSNKENLDLAEIFDICVAVCMEISQIKIDIISEEEKKKYQTVASTSEEPG